MKKLNRLVDVPNSYELGIGIWLNNHLIGYFVILLGKTRIVK